jgi:Flp pilus assembly protein TadG
MTLRRLVTVGRHADRGTVAVELVLLAPLFLALLLFVVGLGRLAEARSHVTGAARDAARAASQQRTPAAARAAAEQTATADLAGAGLSCAHLTVQTDTVDFVPGGVVRVAVECTADLRDLVGVGLPTTKTLQVTAAAPLETYKELRP